MDASGRRAVLRRQRSKQLHDLPIELQLDQSLPLGVVLNAREFDKRRILRPWACDQTLHQVQSLADADDLADFGE